MLKEQQRSFFSALTFPTTGILAEINRLAHFVVEKKRQITRVKSVHEEMDSVSIVEQVGTIPRLREPGELEKQFKNNFEPYFGEYAIGTVEDVFEMPIDPDAGVLGTEGTYQEGIKAYVEGYARRRKSLGKKALRAELEGVNWLRVKEWSTSSDTNDILVWSSPPYLKGKNRHSFIFAYHKVSPTLAKVYQWRCWPKVQQHKELQQNIAHLGGQTEKIVYKKDLDQALQVIHTILELSPSFATPLLKQLWAEDTISKIKTTIYDQASTWHTRPEDMPKVDREKFNALQAELTPLYLQEVLPLLHSVPHFESLDSPEWQRYIETPEFKKLIQKLDVAFALLISQPLKKWVEVTNETTPRKTFDKVLQKTKKVKHRIQNIFVPPKPTIAEKSSKQIKEELKALYDIKMCQIEGMKLTRQQVLFYNSLAPDLIKLESGTNSVGGQCGEATDLSSFINGSGDSGAQVSGDLSDKLFLTPEDIKSMPKEYKIARRAELEKFEQIIIANELFWVDPDQRHFYEKLKRSDDGIIYGPCGLPLPDNFCVPNDLYFEQLKATYDFDTLEESLLQKAKTEAEKAQVRKLFGVLMDKLIPKTIDPEAALLGNKEIVRTPIQQTKLMNELVSQLKHSTKPAVDLQILILDLDKKERQNLVATIMPVTTTTMVTTTTPVKTTVFDRSMPQPTFAPPLSYNPN